MNSKHIGRTALLSAGILFSLACAAHAAQAPTIALDETGVKDEYSVTLRDFDSSFCSVQFDIELDGQGTAAMKWADNASSTFAKVTEEKDGERKRLTFYYDKVTPLTNSSDAYLGSLTLEGVSEVSTSGHMKAVTAKFSEHVYEDVALSVEKSGGGGSVTSGSKGGNRSVSTTTGEAPMITWDDVRDSVKTVDGKKTLTVDMRENPKVSAALLRSVGQEKIVLILDYGSYRWVIDGATVGRLEANRVFYNLSIQQKNYKNVSMAAGGADILQFEIAYDGAFPFDAVLEYALGADYAEKTLYLGQYRDENGTLTYSAKASADEKGLVRLPFEHASKYVLLTQNIWGDALEEKSNPETGGPVVRVPALGGEEMTAAQLPIETGEASQVQETDNGVNPAETDGAVPAAGVEKENAKNPARAVPIGLAAAAVIIPVGVLALFVVKTRRGKKR